MYLIDRGVPKTVATVLAGLLAVSFSFAGDPPSGHHDGMHHGPGGRAEGMMHEPGVAMAFGPAIHAIHSLDLSEQQRGEIHEIFMTAMNGDLGKVLKQMTEAHRNLDRAVWSPDSNDAQIGQLETDLLNDLRQLDLQRRLLSTQVLAKLTEAQRGAFAKSVAEFDPAVMMFPPAPPSVPSPPSPPQAPPVR